MTKLTTEEQTLWELIELESDDVVLEVFEKIAPYGSMANQHVDDMAIKVLSQALIKVLAIAAEKTGDSLPHAYLKMSPMHAELVKFYMLKERSIV